MKTLNVNSGMPETIKTTVVLPNGNDTKVVQDLAYTYDAAAVAVD